MRRAWLEIWPSYHIKTKSGALAMACFAGSLAAHLPTRWLCCNSLYPFLLSHRSCHGWILWYDSHGLPRAQTHIHSTSHNTHTFVILLYCEFEFNFKLRMDVSLFLGKSKLLSLSVCLHQSQVRLREALKKHFNFDLCQYWGGLERALSIKKGLKIA